MKKLFLFAFFLIFLAFNVNAIAEFTYRFNVNNVEIGAYNCLDSGCYTVGPFSGSFPDGKTTANGRIRIRYPSSLATPYGYAVYYVSNGYVPMEYKTTWHTFGYPGIVTGSFNINFYKIQNCYSIIDTFSVTNDVAAYQPLQVLVDASLDATTYSAFHETQTGVGYVPPQFKDQYYSADTAVALTIRDNNNNVVNTQSQPLTLYMSTSQRVEFTWTPTLNGSYTATVATDVTDNQCSSSLQASSSKEFNVLPAGPTNECYTLLNNLFVRDPQSADDDVYTVNNQLIINYTKISNYADASSALTAVQTQAAYTIADSNGAAVFSSSLQLPANPDATSPTKQSFSWTPINPGWYDVNVSGTALSALCTGLNNPQEKISEHFYVRAIPTYSLNFQVADSTDGSMISGAAINVNGNTAATDTNGQATISGLPAGTYSYTITHPSYYTVTGTIQIVDVDMDIFLTMSPSNRPPVITNIPDISMDEDTVYNLLDLDDYVIDSDNDDSELSWAATGNSNIAVSINSATHIATFTPALDWTGQETITFTATDPEGASASDTIIVAVDSVNDAPIISNLPDQNLNEDSPLFDVFNLNDYASDTETPDSALTYSIAAVTDANCGVSIDANDNIDIQPTLNWYGSCTVTIQVSDSALTATDSFVVAVNSVNDAPVVAGLPDVTFQTGSSDSSIDLDYYAYDVEDADNLLAWSYSGNTNVNIAIGSNNVVTFTAAPGFTGSETITFTATDTNSASDSDSMVVSVTPVINNPPTITNITDQTLNEDSGLNDNIIDLWAYASDIETADSGLIFTITAETNTAVVDCAVDSSRYIDCTTQANQNGYSDVTVQVSDGSLTATDIFRVNVNPISDNPTVTITAPTGGETISGTYALTWTATDPDQSSSTLDIMLQYRYNGTSWITLEDAMNNNDGSFSWDTTAVSDANDYSLRIIATDDALNTANDSINQFAIDNPQAPNVNITAPSVGEIINGVYPVTWTATDLEQASSTLDILLQYRCCGNTAWTDLFSSTNNPSIYSWDTTTVPNSNDYELRAIATDDSSLTGTGYVSQFTIGPNSPTVSIITPVDGETINGTYSITWTATDPDQAVNTLDVLIEYRYNGTSWTNLFNSTNNPGIYSWDTTALSDANDYRLRITVTDDNGQTGIDTIGQFTVDNPSAPNAAIDQPLQGAIWSGVKNVTWTATDLEQPSSTLDILLQSRCCGNAGWTNLFSSANNPSYYTWNTTAVQNSNDYELRVIATDDSSLTGTGYVSQFTVNNIQLPLPTAPRAPKPQNKIRIEAINIPADFVKAGDDLVINLDFENNGDLDLDDVSATVVIPELGIRKKVGPFDVDKSSDASRAIILPIPEDAKPGEYTARITISNDKLKRVRHRPVIIK